MIDQGSYIAGSQWQAWSGSPAVPGTGETANGVYFWESGRSEIRASAAPTVGSWIVGDRCLNTNPASGPPGWVCVSAGIPGTWVALPSPTVTQTISTSVTLGASGNYIVLISSGGTPTLPTAVSNAGVYVFKNIDTSEHTISTTSSQTIDGATTFALSPGAAIQVVSDGSNWRVF